MVTKQLISDRELLDAINPRVLAVSQTDCEHLRLIYRALPKADWLTRPDLLKRSSLTKNQFAHSLSLARLLRIVDFQRPNSYRRSRDGLELATSRHPTVTASPLERLNKKQRDTLERVDWNSLKITPHYAWLIACLMAQVRSKREATKEALTLELGWNRKTMQVTVKHARRVNLVTFDARSGTGNKGTWTANWSHAKVLPRHVNGGRASLAPSHRRPKYCEPQRAGIRISEEQQKLLDAIDWRCTSLKTFRRWECVKTVVKAVGNKWDMPLQKLAIEIETTNPSLNKFWVPWAIEAGVIKRTRNIGSTPGSLEVLWDAIEALAGEKPEAKTNGHAGRSGAANLEVVATSASPPDFTAWRSPAQWEKLIPVSWKTIRRRIKAGIIHAESRNAQSWRLCISDLKREGFPVS